MEALQRALLRGLAGLRIAADDGRAAALAAELRARADELAALGAADPASPVPRQPIQPGEVGLF